MRLYNALVGPVMDYGAAVLVTAQTAKEMGKIQREAMLKASGCLSSTSTDALKVHVLTNTAPLDLHLKLKTNAGSCENSG